MRGFFERFVALAKWGGINIVVVLLQRILLARYLGPAALGSFGVALNTATILSRWLSAGVGPATQFYASKTVLDRGSVLGSSLLLATAVGAGALLVGLVVGPVFIRALLADDPLGASMLRQLVPFLPVMQMAMVASIYLLARDRTRAYGLAQLYPNLLLLAVVIYALMADRGVGVVVIGQQALWVAAAVLSLAFALSDGRPVRLDRTVLRDLTRYGISAWPAVLFRFGTARVTVVLGAVYLATTDLGQYVVAVGIAEALLIGQGMLSQLLLNRVSDVGAEADRLFFRVMRLLTWCQVALALVIAAIGRPFFILLYGQEFATAWMLLMILLVMTVCRGLVQLQLSYISGRGFPGRASFVQAVEFVSLFAVVLPVTARFGVVGLATVAVSASALALLAGTAIVRLLTEVRVREMFALRMADLRLVSVKFTRL